MVPSLSETFGLVILEAWAAKRPVLATCTGGALDLVTDGKDAHLFDLESPRTFHGKADRVLNDPQQARDLGHAGFERAKEFDTVRLAGRMRDLYAELVDEKLGTRGTRPSNRNEK